MPERHARWQGRTSCAASAGRFTILIILAFSHINEIAKAVGSHQCSRSWHYSEHLSQKETEALNRYQAASSGTVNFGCIFLSYSLRCEIAKPPSSFAYASADHHLGCLPLRSSIIHLNPAFCIHYYSCNHVGVLFNPTHPFCIQHFVIGLLLMKGTGNTVLLRGSSSPWLLREFCYATSPTIAAESIYAFAELFQTCSVRMYFL